MGPLAARAVSDGSVAYRANRRVGVEEREMTGGFPGLIDLMMLLNHSFAIFAIPQPRARPSDSPFSLISFRHRVHALIATANAGPRPTDNETHIGQTVVQDPDRRIHPRRRRAE